MVITDSIFNQIMEDFKDNHYIDIALNKNKVRPFDFYDFIENNEEYNNIFNKIQNFNNLYLESIIQREAFEKDKFGKTSLEFIKNNNKKKFTQKIEIDTNPLDIDRLSDDELSNKIKEYQDKLTK